MVTVHARTVETKPVGIGAAEDAKEITVKVVAEVNSLLLILGRRKLL